MAIVYRTWEDTNTWSDLEIWTETTQSLDVTSQNGKALYRLLPTGEAWPPENEDTVLKQFLYGIGFGLDRLDLEADTVLEKIFPGDTGTFLTDWEDLLGLPKCSEISLNLQERAKAVLAMLNVSQFSNAEFYEGIGTAFGYDITVRSGTKNEFGGGDRDVFYLVVTVVGVTATYFTAGLSSAGDPLVDTNSDGVECLLNFFKHAHTVIKIV